MDYDNLTIEELFEEFKKQYYKLSEIASDSLNTTNASNIHSDVMNAKDLNSYADEIFITSQQTDELIKFKEIANTLDNKLTPTKNGTSFTENFIIEHNEFGFHKTDIKDWDDFSAKAPDDISGINDDIDEANRLRREAEEEITEEITENPDGSITRKGPGYEYRENVPLEEFKIFFGGRPSDTPMPAVLDDIKGTSIYDRTQFHLWSMNLEYQDRKKFLNLIMQQYDIAFDYAKNLSIEDKKLLMEAMSDRLLILDERYKQINRKNDVDLSLQELEIYDNLIENDAKNLKNELPGLIDQQKLKTIDNLPDLSDAQRDQLIKDIDEINKATDPRALGGVDPNVEIPDTPADLGDDDLLDLARELGIVEEGPIDTSNLSDEAIDKLNEVADDTVEFYDMNDIEQFANGNTRITPEQAQELQEMTGIFQNKADEIANKLPLETVVRNKLSKKLSEMSVRWTTFSGAGELLDIYETAVLLFYGLVAAKPELEKLATNYMIDMYNIMAEPYGAKINRDEYTPDWKYINEQLENAERITPTDIIIKKTGELIEGVAETGMVTGFGYVPTTADKLTKTIKSPSLEEEKVEDPMYDRIKRTFSGKFTK
tara:strand:+ start:1712 stop:3511 length:1800 start_codon:yes stop_codon:yes gene_type:complete